MIKTLSPSASGKLAILASALIYTGASFGVATSSAPVNAAGTAYYSATLAAPASEQRFVASGVAWTCEGTTCVAGKASARPLRICRGLNRKSGEIANFKVLGQPMEEAELAKCNG
ncbi:MAG: CC_3452 family protein [Erythrobacter sp.]